jgi:hypothetical protein
MPIPLLKVPARIEDLRGDVLFASSSRGDILYRDATGWNRLAAGTSGRVLKTFGAGADPAWSTIADTDVVGLAAALAAKAADSAVVHLTGNETVGGDKTLTGTTKFGTSGAVFFTSPNFSGSHGFTIAGATSPNICLQTSSNAAGDGPSLCFGGTAISQRWQFWMLADVKSFSFLNRATDNTANNFGHAIICDSSNRIATSTPAGASGYLAVTLTDQFTINVRDATWKGLVVVAASGQSAKLAVLKGVTSTAAVRDMAAFHASWATSTDASRKGRATISACDWTGTDREGLRIESDGANARVSIAVPASAPTDANILAGQVAIWLDEAGNKLKFRVRYSDGTTLKSGEVALV